jgi:hypothetical protein
MRDFYIKYMRDFYIKYMRDFYIKYMRDFYIKYMKDFYIKYMRDYCNRYRVFLPISGFLYNLSKNRIKNKLNFSIISLIFDSCKKN